MNLVSVSLLRNMLYTISKLATSNCMYSGVKILPGPKGHRKSDLADESCCCPKDYSIEESPTGKQCYSGQPHLVEGLQQQYVQGTVSIDKDSVELDLLDNGADN
jgi:hypothetical protein